MGQRIVMLTSQYLPNVFGGAEQQCKRLSEELAARGNDVTILTSCYDPFLAGERMEGALRVIRFLTKAPPQAMGRRIFSSIQWSHEIKQWLRAHKNQFDLIHCHQAKFNAWVGTSVAKELGKPCLVKLGNAGDRMDLLRLTKKRFFYGHWMAGAIKRLASRFVVISTDMASDLEAFGVDKKQITYIPNGIRPPEDVLSNGHELARKARTNFGLPDDATIFLFAGRLDRQKNVATLIQGFAKVAVTYQDALLLIVGAGDEDVELKQQAAMSIPDGQVRFLGRQEDVWPLYAAADCFVLPALAEGLSNALLEAQASALPVIATAVSGTRDFVQNGRHGFLFEPRDATSLARHLKSFLEMSGEERQAMGESGRDEVLSRAAMDMVAGTYEALYEELLAPTTSILD